MVCECVLHVWYVCGMVCVCIVYEGCMYVVCVCVYSCVWYVSIDVCMGCVCLYACTPGHMCFFRTRGSLVFFRLSKQFVLTAF